MVEQADARTVEQQVVCRIASYLLDVAKRLQYVEGPRAEGVDRYIMIQHQAAALRRAAMRIREGAWRRPGPRVGDQPVIRRADDIDQHEAARTNAEEPAANAGDAPVKAGEVTGEAQAASFDECS